MKGLLKHAGFKYGMLFGLILALLTLLSMIFGVGTPIIVLLASLFHGYADTIIGGIIGFLWGLVAGYVVAVLMDVVKAIIH